MNEFKNKKRRAPNKHIGTKVESCNNCGRDYYIKPRFRKKKFFDGCPYCNPAPNRKRCLRCDDWFVSEKNYVCTDCKETESYKSASYFSSIECVVGE